MSKLSRTNDEPRRYVLDGVEIPGVTDILSAAGYIDKDRYESFGRDGYYRDRGSFIHEACDLIDRGVRLTPGSIEGYKGYVTAYLAAKMAMPEPPLAIEQSRAHTVLRYAGTLDRLYQEPIGDLKTAKQTAAWWRLQLVAYAILVGPPYRPLFDLQLKEDGSYRFIHVTAEDYIVSAFRFLSALADYHRKAKLPAKTMHALVREAVHTLGAIEDQYAISEQIVVRDGQDQTDRLLAHRVIGEGTVWEAGSQRWRERAPYEAGSPTSDRGDAGEGRRAA